MVGISVVVPVYNKKGYLEKCINSVLESSFKDFEIICIDDASTDGSRELLIHLQNKDSRIEILENDENRGVAYTRNRGIARADGKYIFFVDADDYLDVKALQIYYSIMEEKNAEGCFINLQITSGKQESGIKGEYPEIYSGLELMDLFVKNDEFFLYACGAIWRNDFLKTNNISFQTLKIGEGGLFILTTLTKAKRVIYSNYAGYNYVVNETSANKSENAMHDATIGQLKQIIYMIECLQSDRINNEIAEFLEWYVRKNIGGIKNLRLENEQKEKYPFINKGDRFLFNLIKGKYLDNEICIDDEKKKEIIRKGKVYLYGAGYETLDAIKYCHQMSVEIVKIFVTSKRQNPDNMYGFHIYEFDKSLIDDFAIPFIITAHKKHHVEILETLKKCGIKTIVGI